jgi:hypothetical protein
MCDHLHPRPTGRKAISESPRRAIQFVLLAEGMSHERTGFKAAVRSFYSYQHAVLIFMAEDQLQLFEKPREANGRGETCRKTYKPEEL